MILKNKAYPGRYNYFPLVCCSAGVAVDLLLGLLVSALGLPLYLDMVGTVAVAVIGGFLPGVIVGFVTNIIKSFSNPSSIYYGVLNVMIAVVAAGFLRPPLEIGGDKCYNKAIAHAAHVLGSLRSSCRLRLRLYCIISPRSSCKQARSAS